jgi:hypothetical protein
LNNGHGLQCLVSNVGLAAQTPNQYGHQVLAWRALASFLGGRGLATMVARRPWLVGVFGGLKLAAAFLRLPEVRLIGLKDACYALGLVPNDRLKEPVSPPESGTNRHAQFLGRLPNGQTFLQALTVLKKLFLGMKMR